jgi:rhodanese-related sulfurtransferase
MTTKTISPRDALTLMEKGALLVDIRGADEYAREHIPTAVNVPLAELGRLDAKGAAAVIFHCKSGMRTSTNADALVRVAGCETHIVEGGIDGWRAAGLATTIDRGRPIDVMRQVQLTAGVLVLIGVLLGFLASPVFFGLSAFVGGGLMMAGATGWCGMANLLRLMPWNRRAFGA